MATRVIESIDVRAIRTVLTLSALLVLLSSCTISKKDCLRGDWQTIGYKDGRAGKSSDVINDYASSCAKHGTTPDASAYTAGFDAGILLYCTPENGFEKGEKNLDYRGVCPVDLEPAFLDKYIAGLEVAMVELEIDYDRDSLELDLLREERDRRESDGDSLSKVNKEIKSAGNSLRYNTQQRESISNKIRRWKSR